MYTIVILLFAIGAAGGFVAIYQSNENGSKDQQTAQNSSDQSSLKVKNSEDTQSANERDSLNPQQSANGLQPASGSDIYSTFEGAQATGRP